MPLRCPKLLLVHRPGSPQTEVRVGHLGPSRHVEEYHALVTLNAVLGGQFTSRINPNLREARGLTYGAHTGFDFRARGGAFSCDTAVQADATPLVVREILAEFAPIGSSRPVDGDELSRAKSSLTRGYVRHFETPDHLAQAADRLATFDLPDETFERFVPAGEAVTAADVSAAAVRHMRPDDGTIVLVGDGTGWRDDMTLMPALASFSLKRKKVHKEPRLIRRLKEMYRPILAFALRRRTAVITLAIASLCVSGILATRLGMEFVPRLMEGSIVINTVRLASVSLDESVRYGTHLERTLLEKLPNEIERIWTRTGSAEIATDPMGVELSDIFITLKPRDEWQRAHTQGELVAAMEKELKSLPGMRMIFTQPIEMRVNDMIAGIRSDVGIKIFGDDFKIMKAKAKEIACATRAALLRVPGYSMSCIGLMNL